MKRARSIVLVGCHREVQLVLERLRELGEDGRIAGTVGDAPAAGFEDLYIGTLAGAAAIEAIGKSEAAVLFESDDPSKHLRMRMLELRGAAGFFLYARTDDVVLSPRRTAKLADRDLIEIAARPSLGAGAVAKRILDLLAGGLLLLLSLPVLLVVGAVIFLETGRPVVLRQRRMGLDGSVFEVLKFRTLYVGSENGIELVQPNDSRVTRCGTWLRRHRLDELPQLWNVMRGEMSLVGPRPERPERLEAICMLEPAFALRTLVKPGITGLAQVLGEYDTGPREKLVYDLQYMTTWTLALDLRILVQTVGVVLAGRGT